MQKSFCVPILSAGARRRPKHASCQRDVILEHLRYCCPSLYQLHLPLRTLGEEATEASCLPSTHSQPLQGLCGRSTRCRRNLSALQRLCDQSTRTLSAWTLTLDKLQRRTNCLSQRSTRMLYPRLSPPLRIFTRAIPVSTFARRAP